MTSSDCRFFDPLTFWNTLSAGARARGIGGSKNFDWRLLIGGIEEFSSENGGGQEKDAGDS